MAVCFAKERATSRFTATITDDSGAGLSSASITTFQWTLKDAATGTIINSRNNTDVLNTNGYTVSTAGAVVGRFDPADNIIVGTRRPETHIARYHWTWGSPVKTGICEIEIEVQPFSSGVSSSPSASVSPSASASPSTSASAS